MGSFTCKLCGLGSLRVQFAAVGCTRSDCGRLSRVAPYSANTLRHEASQMTSPGWCLGPNGPALAAGHPVAYKPVPARSRGLRARLAKRSQLGQRGPAPTRSRHAKAKVGCFRSGLPEAPTMTGSGRSYSAPKRPNCRGNEACRQVGGPTRGRPGNGRRRAWAASVPARGWLQCRPVPSRLWRTLAVAIATRGKAQRPAQPGPALDGRREHRQATPWRLQFWGPALDGRREHRLATPWRLRNLATSWLVATAGEGGARRGISVSRPTLKRASTRHVRDPYRRACSALPPLPPIMFKRAAILHSRGRATCPWRANLQLRRKECGRFASVHRRNLGLHGCS